MASLGQELKKERELRGISLKEISDSTKINLRFLQALEKDQLDLLPGTFFTRGILRSYADYVGLDQDSVLNKYYEDAQRRQEQKDEEEKDSEKSKPRFCLPPQARSALALVLIVIVLAAVIVALYFFSFNKDTKTSPPQALNPALKIETSPPLQAVEILAPQKETGIEIQILFEQETWIQLIADGVMQLDGVQYGGDSFRTRAVNEIILNLGNAGGFTFSLNGKKGKPLGRPGEVMRNITLTSENLSEFIEQEVTAFNAETK